MLPLVYDELRRLAAHKMGGEPPGQTLQATALVHEAWLKLAGDGGTQWNSRGHFFGAAAEAMRRIMIDRARTRQAQRHGGRLRRVELDDAEVEVPAPETDDRLLAIHEVLGRFERTDPDAAKLVKLRCFIGMSMPEAADAMNIPLRSAERVWSYARAWMRRELGDEFT